MIERTGNASWFRRGTAWRFALLLVAGAAATIASCLELRGRVIATARAEFEREATTIAELVRLRFVSYGRVLEAGAQLLETSDDVRALLRAYVDGSGVIEQFPGIQAVGFAPRVAPTDALRHVEAMHRAGFVGYAIWPVGDRAVYFPVSAAEPYTARNARALGYDLYHEAERRRTMDRAAATGKPTMTGIVRLVQDQGDPALRGFILFVPVMTFVSGGPALEPRHDLRGFLYAPFRAGDQFRGAFAGIRRDLRVTIYDGESVDEANLLYRSAAKRDATPRDWSATRAIPVHGRTWTMRVEARSAQRTAARLRYVTHGAWIGAALTMVAAIALLITMRRTDAGA